MGLKSKLALRFAAVLPCGVALLFLPAGSLRFWQGWVFLALFSGFSLIFTGYFLRHDPQLLERRMHNREREPGQKFFRILWVPLWIGGILLAGLDYRFAWSAGLVGATPLWLVLAAQALIACSWFLLLAVMRSNSFASSIIQVEAGQSVISTGPYRLVRHPMYSALVIQAIFTPLALGSYVTLPVFALQIPVLVVRLLNEEKFLRRELPGYSDYCRRVRFRLIPFAW